MKKSLLTIILICFSCTLYSQIDSIKITPEIVKNKIRINKIWITQFDIPGDIKGVLYKVNDSSLLLSSSINRNDYRSGNYSVKKIDYSNINLLKVRSSKHRKIGFYIGTATGIALGVVTGLSAGDDPAEYMLKSTAKEKAITRGVFLGALFGGIGTMIGAARIVIPINGNKSNFYSNKNILEKYSVR
jgi:hypothetical protein